MVLLKLHLCVKLSSMVEKDVHFLEFLFSIFHGRPSANFSSKHLFRFEREHCNTPMDGRHKSGLVNYNERLKARLRARGL